MRRLEEVLLDTTMSHARLLGSCAKAGSENELKFVVQSSKLVFLIVVERICEYQ
jgi:hypothetical protein